MVVTEAHKAKMAEGRRATRAVEVYLAMLEEEPKVARRRKAAVEAEGRLVEVEAELETASGIDKLTLLQEREDLRRAVEGADDLTDTSEIEAAFVAVASAYGERKGISYSTWREFGVPKPVLEAAGIRRTRRPNVKK